MKKESIEALLLMINSDESASKFNDVTEYREHLKKFIKFCDLLEHLLEQANGVDTSNDKCTLHGVGVSLPDKNLIKHKILQKLSSAKYVDDTGRSKIAYENGAFDCFEFVYGTRQ